MFPTAWGCNVSPNCLSPLPAQSAGSDMAPPRPSSPGMACTGGGGPLAIAVGCLTSSWLAYDLSAHTQLLKVCIKRRANCRCIIGPTHPPLHGFLSVSLSVCLSGSLSVILPTCLSGCLAGSLSTHLPAGLSVVLSFVYLLYVRHSCDLLAYQHVCHSVCLPVCLVPFACLSVRPPVCPVCLSLIFFCLPVCPSILLPTCLPHRSICLPYCIPDCLCNCLSVNAQSTVCFSVVEVAPLRC